MKPARPASFLGAIALAASSLTGCAGYSQGPHGRHHSGDMAAQGSMPMGGPQGGHMGRMNRDDACGMEAMHERMMSARTPEERRALMAEHMRSMSLEMMQRHMEMMQMEMDMMRQQMGSQAPGR
ncbi:hypothetical protein [Noviherbaspirillum massiliense]|uniref:hypothetical protein n=1 Tax=Noviherbaspirillum massiliense TaxID=1465823 RepID=UPI0002E09E63|nr:hypothetical protein [Noviherbaspirillum massiliense]